MDFVLNSQQVLLELSDMIPSLVNVEEMSGYLTLNNEEMERLQSLKRQWVETVTQATDDKWESLILQSVVLLYRVQIVTEKKSFVELTI